VIRIKVIKDELYFTNMSNSNESKILTTISIDDWGKLRFKKQGELQHIKMHNRSIVSGEVYIPEPINSELWINQEVVKELLGLKDLFVLYGIEVCFSPLDHLVRIIER
jgi:hypothetical protein